VNVPKWRILENYIGNDNVSGVHEFNETRPSKLKSSPPPHVPPDTPLAINCPILTYENNKLRYQKEKTEDEDYKMSFSTKRCSSRMRFLHYWIVCMSKNPQTSASLMYSQMVTYFNFLENYTYPLELTPELQSLTLKSNNRLVKLTYTFNLPPPIAFFVNLNRKYIMWPTHDSNKKFKEKTNDGRKLTACLHGSMSRDLVVALYGRRHTAWPSVSVEGDQSCVSMARDPHTGCGSPWLKTHGLAEGLHGFMAED
jgi:hypothetical protein